MSQACAGSFLHAWSNVWRPKANACGSEKAQRGQDKVSACPTELVESARFREGDEVLTESSVELLGKVVRFAENEGMEVVGEGH